MFCDISPTCYKIALQKEIIKRHIKNFLRHERYADTRQSEPLPCPVADCSSHLIKRGQGHWTRCCRRTRLSTSSLPTPG